MGVAAQQLPAVARGIATLALLLSLPAACMAFGIVMDDSCRDSPESGIPGRTCAEVKRHCSGAPFSAALRKNCPKTCGACGELDPDSDRCRTRTKSDASIIV